MSLATCASCRAGSTQRWPSLILWQYEFRPWTLRRSWTPLVVEIAMEIETRHAV